MDVKILIDPPLAGKSREEMGLEPFVDPEIRSSIMGVTPHFPNIQIFSNNNQSKSTLNGMLHFLKIINEINNNLFFKTSQNTSQRNLIQQRLKQLWHEGLNIKSHQNISTSSS